MDQRRASQAAAREYRTKIKEKTQHAQAVTRDHVCRALEQAESILSDSVFVGILHGQRIPTLPIDAKSLDVFLRFVVFWRFFYPLLAVSEIDEYLRKNRPSFPNLLKDAFILLISNGPFPHQICTRANVASPSFPTKRAKRSSHLAKNRIGVDILDD